MILRTSNHYNWTIILGQWLYGTFEFIDQENAQMSETKCST